MKRVYECVYYNCTKNKKQTCAIISGETPQTSKVKYKACLGRCRDFKMTETDAKFIWENHNDKINIKSKLYTKRNPANNSSKRGLEKAE